jgi:flagellar biosynthesis chaperone FliJ
MNTEQITTIVLNAFVTGCAATFLFFVMRGLKREIQNLNKTMETNTKVLDGIERRITETEKEHNIYKTLFDDLPGAVDKYSEIIRKTKDSVIEELEKANQYKDEKLKQVAELRLKEIEVVQPIITQLSTLNDNLHHTINEVQAQLRSLDNISHMTSAPLAYSILSSGRKEDAELAPRRLLSPSSESGKAPGKSPETGRLSPLVPVLPESHITQFENKLAPPLDLKNDEKSDE